MADNCTCLISDYDLYNWKKSKISRWPFTSAIHEEGLNRHSL